VLTVSGERKSEHEERNRRIDYEGSTPRRRAKSVR
jgi:hypothetical protein